jgi:hypothetical protein
MIAPPHLPRYVSAGVGSLDLPWKPGHVTGSLMARQLAPGVFVLRSAGMRADKRSAFSRLLKRDNEFYQLLEVRVGGGQSTLAWLGQTAYAATTVNFPKLIERLTLVAWARC